MRPIDLAQFGAPHEAGACCDGEGWAGVGYLFPRREPDPTDAVAAAFGVDL